MQKFFTIIFILLTVLVISELAPAQIYTASAIKADIVSGTDANENLVLNPDGENGSLKHVTASGGTLGLNNVSGALIQGRWSFKWTPTASSQTLDFALKGFGSSSPFNNSQCRLHIRYKLGDRGTADANGIEYAILDSSNAVIYDYVTLSSNFDASVSVKSDIISVPVVCTVAMSLGKVRFRSKNSSPGDFYADNVRITIDPTGTDAARVGHYGSWEEIGAANCSRTVTSTTFATVGADTDCPAPTVTGQLRAAATKKPAPNGIFPAGVYKITMNASLVIAFTTSAFNDCQILAGSKASSVFNWSIRDTATQDYQTQMQFVLELNNAYSGDLELQCKSTSGTITFNNTFTNGKIRYDFYYLGPPTRVLSVQSNSTNRTKYTPTLVGVTTADTDFCDYWKDGQHLHLECKFTATGSSATEARLSLPNGLVTPNTWTGVRQAGGAGIYATAVESGFTPLMEPNVGYITFGRQGSATAGLTKLNGNNLIASTQVFSFRAMVPIAGWSEGVNAFALTGVTTPGVAKPLLFSSRVAAAGTVSNDVGTWTNGNCVVTSTSIYDCPIKPGVFRVAPNCWTEFVTNNQLTERQVKVDNTTTTTTNVRVTIVNYLSTPLAADFNLFCHGDAN